MADRFYKFNQRIFAGKNETKNETKIEECEVAHTRGQSMLPFIEGGSIVWCKKCVKEDVDNLKVGDIVWVKTTNNHLLIHRLISKFHDRDKKPDLLVTKGDPLVISEFIRPEDVIGIATHVQVNKYFTYSLNSGFLARLCGLYGALSRALYGVDKFNNKKHSFTDRKDMFFKGYLFKSFFPVIRLLFTVIFSAVLLVMNRGRKQQERDQKRDVFKTVCLALNDQIRSEEISPVETQTLLNHELSGISNNKYRAGASWEILNKQKTKQLFVALKVQQFWQILHEKCEKLDIPLIPLKGLSLSLSVYDYDPSIRRVGDIDLLIPINRLQDFSSVLKSFGYTPKNELALSLNYQNVKHKAEFHCENIEYPDIDVHTEVIVKKIIIQYTQLKIGDVLDRLITRKSQLGEYKALNEVDEWLYQAYHLAIHHRFSGLKWYLDLKLLIDEIGREGWCKLIEQANSSGLNKTVDATLRALDVFYSLPSYCEDRPKVSWDHFSLFAISEVINPNAILAMKNKHGGAGLFSKLRAGFWEILFIDSKRDQRKAVQSLIFPSHSFLITVLGSKMPLPLYCLVFPFLPLVFFLLVFLYGSNAIFKMIIQKYFSNESIY